MKYIRTGLTFDPRQNAVVNPQGQPQQAGQRMDPGRKYTGEVATGYDAKREQSQKWVVEQQIIERMLSTFPAGSWVLDAPCGTGRFFPLYEAKRFVVRGVDISPDMLQLAGSKIKDPTRIIEDEAAWGWKVANIIEQGTGLEESSVDCALSIRFTRWVMGKYGPEGIKALLAELQRVARGKVIFTARVKDHPHCVPTSLIQESLCPGWAVHEDVAGYEEAYRIIVLGPAA